MFLIIETQELQDEVALNILNVFTEYWIFSSDFKPFNATAVKRRLFKRNNSKDSYRPIITIIILPNISLDFLNGNSSSQLCFAW